MVRTIQAAHRRGANSITPELEPALLPVPVERGRCRAAGFRWGAVFGAAVGGLILLGVGEHHAYVEDLFARARGSAISDWHLLCCRARLCRRRRARGVRSGATCNH